MLKTAKDPEFRIDCGVVCLNLLSRSRSQIVARCSRIGRKVALFTPGDIGSVYVGLLKFLVMLLGIISYKHEAIG